jgi:glycosyltransferase involved in cell wall biosynthesis
MDVLFVCGEAPTPSRQRPHGLLAALARRGHSVALVFADETGTAFDHLAERCRAIVAVRRRMLAAAVAAEAATGRYDLVHVDRSAAGLIVRPPPLPAVLDVAVCGSLRHERALRFLGPLARARRSARLNGWRRGEAALLGRYARVITAYEDDAAALRAWSGADEGQGCIHVVPCPVDTARFAPPWGLRDPATLLLDLRGLRWDEAAAALRAAAGALAVIWGQRTETRLVVLGATPLGMAGRLAGDPRVVFAGAAHDGRGHLAAATAVIAPLASACALQGALEAMATGCALVASRAVAHDLGAVHGEEALVADGPEDLGWAALNLLDDAPFRGRLGRAGRQLVERRHGYERVIAALESVYEAATGSALAEWRLEVGLDRPRLGA